MSSIRDTNFLDRYGDVNNMIPSEIIRYSNRIKVKLENLAEHSYYVAYYVFLVGKDYNIDLPIIYEAVSMAVIHDFPESYTLDLAHDIKYKYKKIKDLLEEAEEAFLRLEKPELLDTYFNLKEDTLQSLLVKIGDALSVLVYTNREKECGNNTKDMDIISNEIRVRLTTLFSKLDKYNHDGTLKEDK